MDAMMHMGQFKNPALHEFILRYDVFRFIYGMFRTLREVIDFYNTPNQFVPNAINRDSLLAKPLGLTEQEKKDLESFLRSLTDRRFLVTH